MNTSDLPLVQSDPRSSSGFQSDPSSLWPSVGSCPQQATLPCVHCGQPTACAANTDPATVFCCRGCRGAYELIQAWGLNDFYQLRGQVRLTGNAKPACSNSQYEQFDRAEFLGKSAPVDQSDGTRQAELALHGLHCAACAWLIENAATAEPGWRSARVNMCEHSIRVIFDPRQTSLSRIARLLDRLGYQLAPLDQHRNQHIREENRRLLIKIATAGFFAANAMWIAISLYAGEATGVAADHRYFLGLAGTGLGALAVAGPGRIFFRGALAALRTWTPHMDLPIALGLCVGTVVGVINSIQGSGDIYFDSLAALVFLLLIGRWLQFNQQQRAARAVDLMLRVTPHHCHRLSASGEQELVLVDTLRSGETICVAAGESVAADGEVVKGVSTLDRSLLTGESVPIKVGMGDQVVAGTVNLAAPIEVRVSAIGCDSRLGRVFQSVESAAAEKTPIVQLADRIGGVFVGAVLMLAGITFLWWYPTGLGIAAAHATALLIVACPCGLALATPLAIAVGLGRAAKCQMLIREGGVFQQLARPGFIWFDKTGTLTEGRQRVSTCLGDSVGLQLAAAIERDCVHPVASAIIGEAEYRKLDPISSAVLEHTCPGGVTGIADGQRVCVGNLAFMQGQQIAISNEFLAALEQCLSRGESPVLIAVNGKLRTLLGLSDPLRAGAQQTVAKLQQWGWRVGILSGDHDEIVSIVARRLGIPTRNCRGSLAPEEKLSAIRNSRNAGRNVVMVGDGANDAAALAAADVGIAVRGGAEVSLQAAPIFISSGRLASLDNLIRGSQRITRLIYVTFAVSLVYNSIAVVLSMAGWVSPLAAALLMPLSSVSVLALTLAAKSFEEVRT